MSMENKLEKTLRFMPEFIKQAIDKEVAKVIEEEIEFAKKRIDERKAHIIAGVILYIQKEINIQTMEDRLIITVRTPNEPNKN